ncbi:MAG: hypothetical protein ABEJ31_06940 [Haloarculaceae archaeon]
MELTDRTLFALVLSAGILLPGLADYALSRAHYPGIGSFVWVLGFGGAVLFIWFTWLRPLDITGP